VKVFQKLRGQGMSGDWRALKVAHTQVENANIVKVTFLVHDLSVMGHLCYICLIGLQVGVLDRDRHVVHLEQKVKAICC
jgi:hypothetical protein